jgi:dTDP-4-amino-4,6-dideoxygalactose transaminase
MTNSKPFVPRKRPATIPGLWRYTARNMATRSLREGDALGEFESAISRRLAGREVAAVGSGRFALILLLQALEIPPPSTIIMASYNASCVPNALQAAGYNIHFVDVDRDTLHLDPKKLPKSPPEGSSALIVTHLEGSPVSMTRLTNWAKKHRLRVIEDAAHALGASVDGKPVGTLADGAIFSLGRGKHLNTMGGGLAVAGDASSGARLKQYAASLPTDSAWNIAKSVVMEGVVATGTNPAVFRAIAAPPIRLARRWGLDPMGALFEDDKDRLEGVPFEWQRRLSNLQARFGVEALDGFDRSLSRRRAIAARLIAGLDGILPIQQATRGADPAWLELTVLVKDRSTFQRALLARGIDTQQTWMDACDTLEAFNTASGGPCPVAREINMQALYLPTYTSLTDAQCDHIIHSVREVSLEGGS